MSRMSRSQSGPEAGEAQYVEPTPPSTIISQTLIIIPRKYNICLHENPILIVTVRLGGEARDLADKTARAHRDEVTLDFHSTDAF
jgi:hypothetical protein